MLAQIHQCQLQVPQKDPQVHKDRMRHSWPNSISVCSWPGFTWRSQSTCSTSRFISRLEEALRMMRLFREFSMRLTRLRPRRSDVRLRSRQAKLPRSCRRSPMFMRLLNDLISLKLTITKLNSMDHPRLMFRVDILGLTLELLKGAPSHPKREAALRLRLRPHDPVPIQLQGH